MKMMTGPLVLALNSVDVASGAWHEVISKHLDVGQDLATRTYPLYRKRFLQIRRQLIGTRDRCQGTVYSVREPTLWQGPCPLCHALRTHPVQEYP